MRSGSNQRSWIFLLVIGTVALVAAVPMSAQSADNPSEKQAGAPDGRSSGTTAGGSAASGDGNAPYQQTTGDYNRRLDELNRALSMGADPSAGVSHSDGRSVYPGDYRIGADDQLEITVLEAPEFEKTLRVSTGGEISFGLIGAVHAAGLTTRELELVIEELLRRNYIKEPHVSVQVRDMQSHPVAVFGAVKRPGVFQIRAPKTVVEILSMAEGLDVDAGDTVIIERAGRNPRSSAASAAELNPSHGLPNDTAPSPLTTARIEPASFSADRTGSELSVKTTDTSGNSPGELPAEPASVVRIDLKKLLTTGDPQPDVLVYPGDSVKVPRAELIYVVGEVGRPGGFQLKTNENVSALQAVAFAQGLTHTSSAAHAKIIRVDSATGKRQEIPLDLKRILAGKTADPIL